MQYLLFFLLIAGCAKHSSTALPTPVNGDLYAHNAVPGVVHIVGHVACTGTFVSTKTVLTAAHCLEGGGPYNIRSNTIQVSTDRGYTMGKTGNYGKNDLGILTFDSPVVSDDIVVPVGKLPAVGDTLTLIGYGCNDVNTRQGGGIKRMGTNVLSDISDYFELNTPLEGRGIIGPKNRAGSCFGDSGSPLLKQEGESYTLLGVDHGARSDSSEQISLYVNVFQEENHKFLERISREAGAEIQGL